MDPSPDLPPVRPQFEGTETIEEGGLRFTYTVGRDHITDPLREILMSRAPIAVDEVDAAKKSVKEKVAAGKAAAAEAGDEPPF